MLSPVRGRLCKETYASSFCRRAREFGTGEVPVGVVVEYGTAPPPPLNGFAIRPKLNGEAAGAFWAI